MSIWLLCVLISFPMVYGCIRYLPVILHHPIWFEGEYDEYYSVTSFDAWDSEKYITLEQAVNHNLGRILETVGIDYSKLKQIIGQGGALKVYAAETSEELTEPGSSPENPFSIDESPRKSIYLYFWRHLNWRGHDRNDSGFYFSKHLYFGHAHNMILQIAYDYGIAAGLLFLGIYLYSIYQIMRKRGIENLVGTIFLLAIFGFAIPEMVLVPGQITVPLMGIMFYFAGDDSFMRNRIM